VARIRIDDELSRRLHDPEHALSVLERRQLVEFARKAKISRVDFVDVSFPGQRLAEFVELILVRNS